MRSATGLILLLLRLTGALAVTMPWQVIYCLPEHQDNTDLWEHEDVHIKQIERDGAIKWTFKVLWYLVRYGYRNSPYEVEARKGI